MRVRFWLFVERLTCTCWIYARGRNEWSWKIPLWPGRDEDGVLNHSLGSACYRLENWVTLRLLAALRAEDFDRRLDAGTPANIVVNRNSTTSTWTAPPANWTTASQTTYTINWPEAGE